MKILRWVLDSIATNAMIKALEDEEVCGLLAAYRLGTQDGPIVDYETLTNVADQPDRRYAVDPDEQLRVWNELEDGDITRVVGWFHSHILPGHGPEMSDEDVRMAADPDLVHLVYAVERDEFRLWRVGRAGDRSSVVSVEIEEINRRGTRAFAKRKES